MSSQRFETIVVSLRSATERRRKVAQVLHDSLIHDWSFYDARLASDPAPIEVDREAQIRDYGRELTDPEVGVFKSHFEILSRFVDSGETDWLLVLEDDVFVDPYFDPRSAIAVAERHSIHHVRLFAKFFKPARKISGLDHERELIRFKSDPSGMQAYLIDRIGALRFLAGIASIKVPIDDELGRYWEHGLVPYAIFPFPVMELHMPSSIMSGRASGNKSRMSRYKSLGIFSAHASRKLRKVLYNATHR